MKVVFLDFDGVLCNHESISAGYKARTAPEQDPYGAHDDCVAALNHIIEQTGAMIVVSSTWRRISKFRTAMAETLSKWSVKGTVLDITPVLNDEIRGKEIAQWLASYSRHPIESFVILDDDSDMGDLRHRLVRTESARGLTMADAERAIALLNNGSTRPAE